MQGATGPAGARGETGAKGDTGAQGAKGDKGDPNATFLFQGIMEVLKDGIDSGKIKNVGEAYTDGWLPANAQRNTEQFLTANNNEIDAVVASNDGTAGGAIAALEAQGLVTHNRAACPQRDGPPAIRVWTAATGWRTVQTGTFAPGQ